MGLRLPRGMLELLSIPLAVQVVHTCMLDESGPEKRKRKKQRAGMHEIRLSNWSGLVREVKDEGGRCGASSNTQKAVVLSMEIRPHTRVHGDSHSWSLCCLPNDMGIESSPVPARGKSHCPEGSEEFQIKAHSWNLKRETMTG